MASSKNTAEYIFSDITALHIIFENSPTGFLLYDKKGTFIKSNKASQKIFGVKNESIFKKHTLFNSPFFPKLSSALLNKRRSHSFDYSVNFSHIPSQSIKKTKALKMLITLAFIPSNKKSYYIINIEDISEQKKDKRLLEESEKTLHTIIQASPVGICLVDKNRMLGWANKAMLKMIGYTQKEILGKDARILYSSPKSYKEAGKMLYGKIKKTGRGEHETVWKRKDGTLFHVHINVQLIFPQAPESAVIASVMDITDRKAAIERIRKSEEFLLAIVDQSPLSMWILDKSGTVIKINQACRKLLKIQDEKDILGKYNIFKDSALKQQGYLSAIEKVYKKGSVVEMNIQHDFQITSSGKEASAEHPFLEVTIFPIKNDQGEVNHAVVMHKDITEVSRLEQQLRQSHKMEAIGRLAGGVAHDFNNILEIISGHADLSRIAEDAAARAESMDIIHHAVKRAADLTSKLLGYAREGKYHSEPVDARSIIEDVYILISQTFEKRISISLNISQGYHLIECDKGQIEQSLLNLCLNAKDAMPNGGELLLEIYNKTLDKAFVKSHIGSIEGPHVAIRIKDQGTGISEDIKPHIFEPFFTTKEKSYHSGMGLPMVYGIVKNHGGYIHFESKMNKGTAFELFFPVLEKSNPPEQHFSSEKKQDNKTGTILFIDDEVMITNLIKKILEANGYSVITAKDGFEAEKILIEKKEDIALIVLDLIMPHISGKETFIKLHNIKKEVPVILSSGFSLNEESQEILDMGAFTYLQKPFDLVKLLQNVQKGMNLR